MGQMPISIWSRISLEICNLLTQDLPRSLPLQCTGFYACAEGETKNGLCVAWISQMAWCMTGRYSAILVTRTGQELIENRVQLGVMGHSTIFEL